MTDRTKRKVRIQIIQLELEVEGVWLGVELVFKVNDGWVSETVVWGGSGLLEWDRVRSSAERSSGKCFRNVEFLAFQYREYLASFLFSESVVVILPCVDLFSSINDNNPVKIEETDHIGFQDSGWKSLIDKQRRVFI